VNNNASLKIEGLIFLPLPHQCSFCNRFLPSAHSMSSQVTVSIDWLVISPDV